MLKWARQREIICCLFLISLWSTWGQVWPGDEPAYAKERRTNNFRILFPETSEKPLTKGPHGEQNKTVMGRIERLLSSPWAKRADLNFLFLADRKSVCTSRTTCNPDNLMWRRVNSVKAQLGIANKKETSVDPYRRLSFAYIHEFQAPIHLPRAPPGTTAIGLMIHIDNTRLKKDSCPWEVLIFDPALPPVIGAEVGKPVIPHTPDLPDNADQHVVFSQGARFRIVIRSEQVLQQSALWGKSGEEFCLADQAVLSGAERAIPEGLQTLHLIATRTANAVLGSFMRRLSSDCRWVPDPPRFLRHGSGKGLGDHVHPLRPGMIAPPEEDVTHCPYTFTPAPAPQSASSR